MEPGEAGWSLETLEGLFDFYFVQPAMLQWVMTEMMRVEAEAKVGEMKGKHTAERKTYFSGSRLRRVDTRLGTVYLLVPKIRKGGYIPFFISERRRSEQALIAQGGGLITTGRVLRGV